MDLFDWLFIVVYGSYFLFGIGLWVWVMAWTRSSEGKSAGVTVTHAGWLFIYLLVCWPISVILFVRQEIKDRKADRMT